MRRKHLLQPDSNTPTFCLIGELLQEFFSFQIFWTSNSHISHRGHNINFARPIRALRCRKHTTFLYIGSFCFLLNKETKRIADLLFLYKAKKLPTVLLKPFLHLNSTDPFRREKKSFAFKNFICNQNPLSLKGFAERLRQFILNTLPQSCKALIKFFIWNCHKSLPELSRKRFHHRLFSHRTASLSSLLHFPSNNYKALKPYSTLIASTSVAIDTLLLVK